MRISPVIALVLLATLPAAAVTNVLNVTNNAITVTGNVFDWQGGGSTGAPPEPPAASTNYATVIRAAGDWGLFENTPSPWCMGHDSNYTRSVWAQWHTWTAWSILWGYGNGGASTRRNLEPSATPGTLRYMHYGYGTTFSPNVVITNYVTGVWYQVTEVHEDDDDVLVYVNAELAYTGNITDDWHDDPSSSQMFLYGGPGYNCANGTWLDEFCIYDAALSPAQVLAAYNSQKNGTNESVAAYIYHMDENDNEGNTTSLFAAAESTASAQTLHGSAVLEWRQVYGYTNVMGPATPPPADKVVTGTISPDATGDYIEDGDYCGQMSYKRTADSACYVWFDGYVSYQWFISTSKGYGPPMDYWTSGSGPNGVYSAGGGYSGDATVTDP